MRPHLFCLVLLFGLASVPAFAAPDQWVEVRSPHFTVITNAGEKQGRHTLDQFERMRWVFSTLYPKFNVDPPEPILIFAAKNGKTFQSFEPQAYLAKGQLSLAGYFLSTSDKNYILLRLDAEQENPFATVYHEYTHLLFRSAADWIPLWFNEGIAEFFQNTTIHDKNVELGKPSADDILYLRQQKLIPLPVLLKIDASSPYYHEEEKGSIFYAESWALTHYFQITDKEKGTHRLFDYLNLVANHTDSIAAAEQIFGNLKQLQSALESYINAGNYKEFVLNSAAAPIDESSYTVRTLTQFQADAARADVLADVQREQEARSVIDSILKADPNNVAAMETMGNIELRANNHEEARKWYAQAVKLDSQSYLANYYFAAMSQGGSSADDALIESSLQAAIKLNPKFAPAYDRLAGLYERQPDKRDQALQLSLQAVKLDPSNLYYRLNAINVLMTLGRFDQALSALQTAVKVAKTPSEVNLVQSRISQVTQIQQARAHAAQAPQGQGQVVTLDDIPGAGAGVQTVRIVQKVAADAAPKHPDAASGPKHSLTGIIQSVTCSYPTIIEFQLKAPAQTVTLYNNNFIKIDLSAAGFNPTGSMNPCKDFEGRTARISYAETTDKTVDGQVLAIELHK
ncbi:tetratricopeptide repeat protein [Terracidiphilus gabretensis]|uniref:tetratricopeptide repeat protein n=1 Tax=Terracidiphilus gabretensis TaxID=1577687 RepID=UPI00071BAB9F|nr:tetratricopeptide repeat protein [Terracidiphilus gabretensis]